MCQGQHLWLYLQSMKASTLPVLPWTKVNMADLSCSSPCSLASGYPKAPGHLSNTPSHFRGRPNLHCAHQGLSHFSALPATPSVPCLLFRHSAPDLAPEEGHLSTDAPSITFCSPLQSSSGWPDNSDYVTSVQLSFTYPPILSNLSPTFSLHTHNTMPEAQYC